MTYREVPPPGFLRGLAEGVWRATAAPGEARAVLPDGCMDLMVVDGELLVAGPDTTSHPAGTTSAAVGVRFAPGSLPGLLGVPAAALRDLRVPLAELHPRLAVAAAAGLDGGAAPTRVLTELAVALLAEHQPDAGSWRAAVRAAAAAGTAADAIADELGVTPRTLHRRCLREFGYGPATLRRVLRFRRAHELLLAGAAPAEAAALAGYADQPHLSREMKALSGRSPSHFAA